MIKSKKIAFKTIFGLIMFVSTNLSSQNFDIPNRILRKNIVDIEGDSVTKYALKKKWMLLYSFEKNKKVYPDYKLYLEFKNGKYIFYYAGSKDTVECIYSFVSDGPPENNHLFIDCNGDEDGNILILKLSPQILILSQYSSKNKTGKAIPLRKLVYKSLN